jgi:hypothetical protein
MGMAHRDGDGPQGWGWPTGIGMVMARRDGERCTGMGMVLMDSNDPLRKGWSSGVGFLYRYLQEEAIRIGVFYINRDNLHGQDRDGTKR